MVTPPAELEKTRSAKGSAYVDFPVNRTEISPTYRRNPEELAKIRSTIDVVANDPDSRITSVTIVGFASPEGSYANNERLAKGRSVSLAEYVRGLYSFDADVMHTSWVAENWEATRNYVATCNLPTPQPSSPSSTTHLSLPTCANGGSNPSSRRTTHSSSQKRISRTRRSDYTVDYVVRSFVTVEEIRQVMATAPQKLSLNEIYVVANFLEPDSTPYREAFELAVRMYPDDPAANSTWLPLRPPRRAQCSSGLSGKAPETPSCHICAWCPRCKQGDNATANTLLKSAADAGIAEAADALDQLPENQ